MERDVNALVHKAQVENVELAKNVDQFQQKMKRQALATRFVRVTLIYLPILIVTHIVLKIYLLKNTYPVAIKWYINTFGVFYPFVRNKTKQNPTSSFRSMWNVCTSLSYSGLNGMMSLLALTKTLRPEQATFLYLCAHHFATKAGADLTAEKWDYPMLHLGRYSPWYKAFTEKWLPIPSVNYSGVSGMPINVQKTAWNHWLMSASENPFTTFSRPRWTSSSASRSSSSTCSNDAVC